jgi:hypothetical protein
MIDLAGIPFIRENLNFKHFLEFESNYLADEDYDPRRTILQGAPHTAGTNSSQVKGGFSS